MELDYFNVETQRNGTCPACRNKHDIPPPISDIVWGIIYLCFVTPGWSVHYVLRHSCAVLPSSQSFHTSQTNKKCKAKLTKDMHSPIDMTIHGIGFHAPVGGTSWNKAFTCRCSSSSSKQPTNIHTHNLARGDICFLPAPWQGLSSA